MKLSRLTILIVIALLVAGSYVFAQNNNYRNNRSDRSDRSDRYNRSDRYSRSGSGGGNNNQVPAAGDYEAFSTFIAKRNIFNPDRIPSFTGTTTYHPPAISRGAPFFALVGTMSYAKGSFAFFDGNSSESRQALQVSGKVQDFTVTAVTSTNVTISSADVTQTLRMGDRMQQENGKWSFLAGNAMNDSGTPASDEGSSSSSDGTTSGSTPANSAPSASSGEANDILKRLMQLREKENQ